MPQPRVFKLSKQRPIAQSTSGLIAITIYSDANPCGITKDGHFSLSVHHEFYYIDFGSLGNCHPTDSVL